MTPRELQLVAIHASLDGPVSVAELLTWLRHPHKQRSYGHGPLNLPPDDQAAAGEVRRLLESLVDRGLMSRWTGRLVTYWPTQAAMDELREADRVRRRRLHDQAPGGRG